MKTKLYSILRVTGFKCVETWANSPSKLTGLSQYTYDRYGEFILNPTSPNHIRNRTSNELFNAKIMANINELYSKKSISHDFTRL